MVILKVYKTSFFNERINRKIANKKAEDITKILNKKIDETNLDPRLRHGRNEGEWYLPIKRTIYSTKDDYWRAPECHDFFEKHIYEWNAVFEYGNSESSSCFNIEYFPVPLEYIKQFGSDYRNEIKAKWEKLNPLIDLSKELFIFSGRPRDIVSNNFVDILLGLERQIEEIAKSRLSD